MRLKQKKYRDREAKILLEGEILIAEAILSSVKIDALILKESAHYADALFSEQLMESLRKSNNALNDMKSCFDDACEFSNELFEELCDTENSQGIMAIAEKPVTPGEELAELITSDDNILVLDRLQDPGNIGTVIRTALGAGYKAFITVKGTADVFSPKVLRATAGAVFRLPVVFADDSRDLVELVRGLGKKLAVTTVDKGVHYYNCNLSKNVALVIGNEGSGVSKELIEASDIRVNIPMRGGLESLNVSVAAGILMYETVRANA